MTKVTQLTSDWARIEIHALPLSSSSTLHPLPCCVQEAHLMNCISGHSGPLGNSWVVPVGALEGDGRRGRRREVWYSSPLPAVLSTATSIGLATSGNAPFLQCFIPLGRKDCILLHTSCWFPFTLPTFFTNNPFLNLFLVTPFEVGGRGLYFLLGF